MGAESAADIECEVGTRSDRAAIAIVDQGINGTGCEVSSRCDGNISASSDMATVVIEDVQGQRSTAVNGQIRARVQRDISAGPDSTSVAVVDG